MGEADTALDNRGGEALMDQLLIRALENEQDDRAKVNGLFGSLNDWEG